MEKKGIFVVVGLAIVAIVGIIKIVTSVKNNK